MTHNVIRRPALRPLDAVLALAESADDLAERASRVHLDEDDLRYVQGVRDATKWAAGQDEKPDLPLHPCGTCSQNGGWDDPVRGPIDCHDCNGSGWVE